MALCYVASFNRVIHNNTLKLTKSLDKYYIKL
jgi:hypothetical protein